MPVPFRFENRCIEKVKRISFRRDRHYCQACMGPKVEQKYIKAQKKGKCIMAREANNVSHATYSTMENLLKRI